MSASVVVLILGTLVVAFAVYFTHTILRARAGSGDEVGAAAKFFVSPNMRQQVLDATRSAGEAHKMSEGEIGAEAERLGEALAGDTKLRRSRCLWVDDDPDGNVHERRTLEHLRVDIDLARSTNQALQFLVGRRYDMIITNLARPVAGGGVDDRAGIKLLKMLAGAPTVPPVIVFADAASDSDERFEDARGAGARATVTKTSALVESVVDLLEGD